MFIELHARLFILHRAQEPLGLFFAHFPIFDWFRLDAILRVFFRLIFRGAFYFAARFLLWCAGRRRRGCGTPVLTVVAFAW